MEADQPAAVRLHASVLADVRTAVPSLLAAGSIFTICSVGLTEKTSSNLMEGLKVMREEIAMSPRQGIFSPSSSSKNPPS